MFSLIKKQQTGRLSKQRNLKSPKSPKNLKNLKNPRNRSKPSARKPPLISAANTQRSNTSNVSKQSLKEHFGCAANFNFGPDTDRLPAQPTRDGKALLRASKGSTLKDLCPEEKKKIGDLIQRLAQERLEKESLEKKLTESETRYENSIKKIKAEKERLQVDSTDLQEKFTQSIGIIKFLEAEKSA